MKPTTLLAICFFSIASLLTSCSSDTASSDQLVQSMVDVATNGVTRTSAFNYNGNKIVSIVNEDASIEFSYLGSLISQTVQTNLTTLEQEVLNYTYTDGNLTKIVSSNNYSINYLYQANGTINYEKIANEGLTNETLLLHGTLNMANENLLSDNTEYDDSPADIEQKHQLVYNYDSNRNPLYNITGFKKLLNFGKAISKNNANNGTEMYSENNIATNQATSSMELLVSTFQYNGNQYPQERASNFLLLDFGVAFPNYEKTIYSY